MIDHQAVLAWADIVNELLLAFLGAGGGETHAIDADPGDGCDGIRAADDLRLVVKLAHRLHDANRAERIRAHDEDVRIGGIAPMERRRLWYSRPTDGYPWAFECDDA